MSDTADSATTPAPERTDPAAPADELDELLGGYEGQAPGDEVPQAAGATVTESDTAPASTAAPSVPERRPYSGPAASAESAPSRWAGLTELKTLWWLPTLLIPMLGGMAAYYALREKRPIAARVLFGVGLAVGVVASLAFVVYARDLAALTNAVQNNQTITQPSTTIAP